MLPLKQGIKREQASVEDLHRDPGSDSTSDYTSDSVSVRKIARAETAEESGDVAVLNVASISNNDITEISDGNATDVDDDGDIEEVCIVSESSKKGSKIRSSMSYSCIDLCNSQPDAMEVIGDCSLEIETYPHLRKDCLRFGGKSPRGTAEDFCEKCFCVICDTEVSACSDWNSHCKSQNQKVSDRNSQVIRIFNDSDDEIVDLSDEATAGRYAIGIGSENSYSSFSDVDEEFENLRGIDAQTLFSLYNRGGRRLNNNWHQQRDTSNDPMCDCQVIASYDVTRKGKNIGRPYFKCYAAMGDDFGCGYFNWADDVDGFQLSSSHLSSANKDKETTSVSDLPEPPSCLCKIAAKRQQVKKNSPNRGRYFYSCKARSHANLAGSLNEGEKPGCNFFQWEDAIPQNSTSLNPSNIAPNSTSKAVASSSASNRHIEIEVVDEEAWAQIVILTGGADVSTPSEPIALPSAPTSSAHSNSTENTNSKSSENRSECVVCFEQPPDSVIVHGEDSHFCSCWNCASLLKRMQKPCPICRKSIDSVAKVYFST